jgi:hypothetical protein
MSAEDRAWIRRIEEAKAQKLGCRAIEEEKELYGQTAWIET